MCQKKYFRMSFEDKLKIYFDNYELILKDKLDYNQIPLSIEDIDEIDDLISLYIMFKNEVLGKLKINFERKLKELDTTLSDKEIFCLLDKFIFLR